MAQVNINKLDVGATGSCWHIHTVPGIRMSVPSSPDGAGVRVGPDEDLWENCTFEVQ